MTDRFSPAAVALLLKRVASMSRGPLVVAFFPALLAGCSGKTSDPAGDRDETIPECVQYADQVRACLRSIGVSEPDVPAATVLRGAARATDEAQRARTKDSCARDLARLRTSCR